MGKIRLSTTPGDLGFFEAQPYNGIKVLLDGVEQQYVDMADELTGEVSACRLGEDGQPYVEGSGDGARVALHRRRGVVEILLPPELMYLRETATESR